MKRDGIARLVLIVCLLLVPSVAKSQDVYTRTDIRTAIERIERHGDEFKDAFKASLQNVALSPRERRVSELAEDLEDEVDNLRRNFKGRHFSEAHENLDTALLIAASVDRFMQRNYFGPDSRRAWDNLRTDLNVIALGYNVPLLTPLLSPAIQSADRLHPAITTDRARARLLREVRHELVMLPYYGVFDQLAFRVDGNTVTLLGQVTRPTLKSSAENVVRDIEGVDRVINEIEVLPLSSNDDRIRLETFRAIYGQATLNRYALQAVPPIHIIVRNGKVTLEGVIASETDRNIAIIQARSVPGVFSVTNNLRVER